MDLRLALRALKQLLSEISLARFIAFLALTCVLTRVVSGVRSRFMSRPAGQEPWAARVLPHWIPYIGHALSWGFGRQRMLESVRSGINEPVFAIKTLGRTHNVITSRSMAEALLDEKSTASCDEPCADYVMEKVFGASTEMQKYNRSDLYKASGWLSANDDSTKQPHVSTFCSSVVRELRTTMSNLVSFSASMVDQCQWERTSSVSVNNESDPLTCEVNFFALIKHYVGSVTTSVFMGSAFAQNFPNVPPDLWLFNTRFNAMLLGIPRFVPGPGLVPAYSARLRLIQTLTVFHTAFAASNAGTDSGFEWRDLDDVSGFMQARARMWIDRGVPPESAAPEDLAALWALNIKLGALVFWNIVRIISVDGLRDKVLKEIAPYAQSSRPGSEETGFHIQEPPRLSLDPEGLWIHCPLFRATIWETIRLHSASFFTYRKLRSDVTLTESAEEANRAQRVRHPYRFREGEYVCVAQPALNMDGARFDEPGEFKPQRFQQEKSSSSSSVDEEKTLSEPDEDLKSETPIRASSNNNTTPSSPPKLELESMLPFTDTDPGDDDQGFSERLVMLFTAAVLVTWDIEPVGSGAWKVPERKLGSLVYGPAKEVRVRMKYKA